MNLKLKVREVPNWPSPGVSFKDITVLLQDRKTFKYVIDKMAKPYLNKKIDKVIAIEARGFLLAAPVAYKIKAGVCLIRKKGGLHAYFSNYRLRVLKTGNKDWRTDFC